jgi:hypothetical protein
MKGIVLVGLLLVGCGNVNPGNAPGGNNPATNSATAKPSVEMNVTTSDGWHYAIRVQAPTFSPTGPAQEVAKPGADFIIFHIEVTNLLTDRPAGFALRIIELYVPAKDDVEFQLGDPTQPGPGGCYPASALAVATTTNGKAPGLPAGLCKWSDTASWLVNQQDSDTLGTAAANIQPGNTASFDLYVTGCNISTSSCPPMNVKTLPFTDVQMFVQTNDTPFSNPTYAGGIHLLPA